MIIAGLVAQKLTLVCNFATCMMLTVSIAAIQIMNTHLHLTFPRDLAYGAVCFWLIPLGIIKLTAMKKAAK